MNFRHVVRRREKLSLAQTKVKFPKNIGQFGKLASAPGSGSGLEDSDPWIDRNLRPKDPHPDSVGLGFVPSTSCDSVPPATTRLSGARSREISQI
jgi:hypothetical protein